MHAEILVEDRSTVATVRVLLSRMVPSGNGHSWRITPFDGKDSMPPRLPGTFRGLARSRHADRVIVVIDQDRDSCYALKQRISEMAASVGLIRTNQPTAETALRIRIVMTELESWFIGDPPAVRAAYPRVTERDMRLRRREPDTLIDASEWLERRLVVRGYYPRRLPKVDVAEAIAPHLNLAPDANASQSFRLFLRTLRETYELG